MPLGPRRTPVGLAVWQVLLRVPSSFFPRPGARLPVAGAAAPAVLFRNFPLPIPGGESRLPVAAWRSGYRGPPWPSPVASEPATSSVRWGPSCAWPKTGRSINPKPSCFSFARIDEPHGLIFENKPPPFLVFFLPSFDRIRRQQNIFLLLRSCPRMVPESKVRLRL